MMLEYEQLDDYELLAVLQHHELTPKEKVLVRRLIDALEYIEQLESELGVPSTDLVSLH